MMRTPKTSAGAAMARRESADDAALAISRNAPCIPWQSRHFWMTERVNALQSQLALSSKRQIICPLPS